MNKQELEIARLTKENKRLYSILDKETEWQQNLEAKYKALASKNKRLKPSFKVYEIEDYHEDLGGVLFISFGRDENGVIQGEPSEFYMGHGYLEDDFDESHWTHFIKGDFNFIFTAADPVNFPAIDNGLG